MRIDNSATDISHDALPHGGAPRRTVRQSSALRNVRYEIRGPIVQRAAELERNGVEILPLNIGNPQRFGFSAPPNIVEHMAQTLTSSHGYSGSHGLPAAIDAVLGHYASFPFPELTPERIFLGNGVSELITMTCQALINNGDEILIPAPDYPLWTAMVTLAGGQVVHYTCDESDDWNPNLADLESKISSRTTAIVVINPNNPTGAVYPPNILNGIADIARRHSLTLLVDEIYDAITYDATDTMNPTVHTHLATLAPDVLTLTYSGLSKNSQLAGYRAGWLVITGPVSHATDFLHGLNLVASTRLCANVPGQQAIIAALSPGNLPGYHQQTAELRKAVSISDLTSTGGRLHAQRDLVAHELNAMEGVSCVTPRGALYAFPRLNPEVHEVHDDEQLVFDLLERERILLVHGTGFNWPTHDHLRIVFLPEVRVLATAMERMGNFLASYRQ